MTMLPGWPLATRVIVPISGVPRARRSAGSSMPRSQPLRTGCVSGAVISSDKPPLASAAWGRTCSRDVPAERVGAVEVAFQQHLPHRLEVLARFLEEDLVEPARVDARGRLGAVDAQVARRRAPGAARPLSG